MSDGPPAVSIRQALRAAETRLSAAQIATAPLDARVLLRHVLSLTAANLYLRLDDALPASALVGLASLVGRRAEGEPVAYLTEGREFFGLNLRVTPDVLIPQPDTELLVERAIALAPARSRVVDVGTGSGAIAVALAHARPDVTVVATDRSLDACRVAAGNIAALGLGGRVTVVCSDLLAALAGPFDSVLANLPYLTSAEMTDLQGEVRWEPASALAGGYDGLDLYRALIADLAARRPLPRLMLCEMAPAQATAMRDLAARTFPGYRVVVQSDLAGRERVVEVVPPLPRRNSIRPIPPRIMEA